MRHDAVAAARPAARAGRGRLRLVEPPPLRVVDVAMAPRDETRAYLDAKARHAALTGTFEHHVICGGRPGAVRRAVGALRPDLVLLHDAFWRAGDVRVAGARVVAVHAPAPALVRPLARRAARRADALMACADTRADCGRLATLPLRLGVDEAFRPGRRRGDHVLYVGKLSREQGIAALLDAAARSDDPWPLRIVGRGPQEGTLRARACRLRLGARISFLPPAGGPEALARHYADARCLVVPGEREAYGLRALEAAACGVPVAACATTPALGAIGALGHRFVPGDPGDLARAIAEAREAPLSGDDGAMVGWRHRWDRVLAAELDALRELL